MLQTHSLVVMAAHPGARGLGIGAGREEAQKEKHGQDHMQGFSRYTVICARIFIHDQ
jgi:hypothetical protein